MNVISASLAISLSLATSATAALLTSESFTTGAGPLDDTITGTGWGGPWDSQNNNLGYAAASANPLVYPNLVSDAGYGVGGDSYRSTGRRINTDNTGPWNQAGLVSDPWTNKFIDRGVAYAAVLLRKEQNNGDRVVAGLGRNNIAWNEEGVRFGFMNGTIGITDGTNTLTTGAADPIGQTVLFVVKADLDNDVASLYINPTVSAGEPAAADLTFNLPANFGFKNLHFHGGNSAGQGSIDEIRLGTTYDAVTPVVPEPASLAALAAAAGLGLLARRRKD